MSKPTNTRMNTPLHVRFDEQARKFPDRIAVSDADGGLTYRELQLAANRLAVTLRSAGVGKEDLVGLCFPRDRRLLTGLLGILKAGAAYVPLDPSYPKERLNLLVRDSGVSLVVAAEACAPLLAEANTQIVGEEVAASPSGGLSVEAPELDGSGSDAAYVIYTSGSTGEPKGVVVEHRNVVRLFDSTNAWFDFGPEDVWTLFHSFGFDFSVWEIWGALLHGGRVVVVPDSARRSPKDFHRLVASEGVTVLSQTPAAFYQLARVDVDTTGRLTSLRHVVFGGERLDVGRLADWIARYGDTRPRLVNMYGITETTVHVTYREITRADLARPGDSPIGHPIPDLDLSILDHAGDEVPTGVPGELYVGGAGVARGYLNRPALTADRFVMRTSRDGEVRRVYRTGDRVARESDGQLYYHGRVDDQLKVRGFRIEPGEVETLLRTHPGVRDAAVGAHDYGNDDVRLIAFLVYGTENAPTKQLEQELSERVQASLPAHMRPSSYVPVPEIPLTAHGKVDRAHLLLLHQSKPSNTSVSHGAPPVSPLFRLCREVLDIEELAPEDDFMDLGATSLTLTRLLLEIDTQFRVEIEPKALLEGTTFVNLQRLVQQQLDRQMGAHRDHA